MCTVRMPTVFRWPPLGISTGGGGSSSKQVSSDDQIAEPV